MKPWIGPKPGTPYAEHLVAAAERNYQVDLWRKQCAQKRALEHDAVSLEALTEEGAAKEGCGGGAPVLWTATQLAARLDVEYLMWYLKAHSTRKKPADCAAPVRGLLATRDREASSS